MRIFPQGLEQSIEPCGKAMVIIARIMLGLAVLAFFWKVYQLKTWHHAEGEVVEAHEIATADPDGGRPLTSAEYTVHYTVQAIPYNVTIRSAYSSSDAAEWQRRVAELPGTKARILYDPRNPSNGLAIDGDWFSFFGAAVVLSVLSVFFWLAGRLGIFWGDGCGNWN